MGGNSAREKSTDHLPLGCWTTPPPTPARQIPKGSIKPAGTVWPGRGWVGRGSQPPPVCHRKRVSEGAHGGCTLGLARRGQLGTVRPRGGALGTLGGGGRICGNSRGQGEAAPPETCPASPVAGPFPCSRLSSPAKPSSGLSRCSWPPRAVGVFLSHRTCEDAQPVVNKGLFLLPHCFLSQRPRSAAKAHLRPPSLPAGTTGSVLPGPSSSATCRPSGATWNRRGLQGEAVGEAGKGHRGCPEPGPAGPLPM